MSIQYSLEETNISTYVRQQASFTKSFVELIVHNIRNMNQVVRFKIFYQERISRIFQKVLLNKPNITKTHLCLAAHLDNSSLHLLLVQQSRVDTRNVSCQKVKLVLQNVSRSLVKLFNCSQDGVLNVYRIQLFCPLSKKSISLIDNIRNPFSD